MSAPGATRIGFEAVSFQRTTSASAASADSPSMRCARAPSGQLNSAGSPAMVWFAVPLVPAGAILILTGWYDNTENNPRNPDADQWVGMGQRTTDEMSHAWIAVTHLDEEGFERLVAERESRPVVDNGGAR